MTENEETEVYDPQVKPPTTLLIGEPGTGKTHSLITYLKAGMKLGVVITDPGGEESLLDACEKLEAPIENLHFRYVAPMAASFDAMASMAEKIGMLSYKDLTEMKYGIDKASHQQFLEMIGVLGNFVCQRTGESFGPVDGWDDTWALAMDSLSGINLMSLQMVIGSKPAAHQGEWGVAMSAEEKLLYTLTSTLNCFLCVTAHVEREMDEVLGKPRSMVGALGRKLAPKIPRTFSDVVLAQREGDKFSWSTAALDVALKARTLPISDNLEPTFEQIVEGYRKRKETARG